ncbi:hypothetical protein ACQ4PT_070945 [Festuca glaucescens]
MEEPMSRLTHDLLAEILSRVPYKSLCVCKCVCPPWRNIIADPVYRKKIAQSLAGFFYQHEVVDDATSDPADLCGFSVVEGISCADLSAFPWATIPRTFPRPPLPPVSMDCLVSLQDSWDGLFLTRIWVCSRDPEPRSRYVISNPATGEYALLPHSVYYGEDCSACLCFDSGASTEEFHVFQFLLEWPHNTCGAPPVVSGVHIYSSKIGSWVSTDTLWDVEVTLCAPLGVFHKGYLHLLMEQSGLAVVDKEGRTWRTIPLPKLIDPGFSGFIGKSAGQGPEAVAAQDKAGGQKRRCYDEDQLELGLFASERFLVRHLYWERQALIQYTDARKTKC